MPANDPPQTVEDYTVLAGFLHAPPPGVHLPWTDRHPGWHTPPVDLTDPDWPVPDNEHSGEELVGWLPHRGQVWLAIIASGLAIAAADACMVDADRLRAEVAAPLDDALAPARAAVAIARDWLATDRPREQCHAAAHEADAAATRYRNQEHSDPLIADAAWRCAIACDSAASTAGATGFGYRMLRPPVHNVVVAATAIRTALVYTDPRAGIHSIPPRHRPTWQRWWDMVRCRLSVAAVRSIQAIDFP